MQNTCKERKKERKDETLLTWWVYSQICVATRLLAVEAGIGNKCKHNYESNQKDATIQVNLFSLSALHISGDVFAHHQEH